MVVLKPKSTSWNSLWSIIYCAIVLSLQTFISYRAITTFQESLLDKWKDRFPPALSAKLALTILALILSPLFIITSLFKVGNYANDGFKLGRDHALCPVGDTFVDKFTSDFIKKLWQNFCPFSQCLHVVISFFLLLPETLLESAEIYYGHQPSSYLWASNVDYFFSDRRRGLSDLTVRMNSTMKLNVTSFVIQDYDDRYVSVEFVFFVLALLTFTVRYASVFWYTNKALSFTFAFQLLFMCIESIFAFTGFSILYKVSANKDVYGKMSIDIVNAMALGPSGVVVLYMFSGTIVLLSTMTVFYYGSQHFHEKFRLVDKKHHPEKYVRHKRHSRGLCSGYVAHTCAVGTLVLLAIFKGPMLYDLVSVYRNSSDSLVLTCIVIDVTYMVFWILLWTLLTVKQKWLFRILDYANVGEPIFVIKSDSLLQTPSISIGSIELKDIQMSRDKRPSSIPSVDITPSESGFDECELPPSSEDERFELSLPPVSEHPDADDENNSVIMRRTRNRRSGARSVTFHDTVRNSGNNGSISSLNRCHSPHGDSDTRLNVTADVHLNSGNRKGLGSPFRRSASEVEYLDRRIERKSSSLPRLNMRQEEKAAREESSKKDNENDNSICTDETVSSVSEKSLNALNNKPPRARSSYAEGSRQPLVISYKPSNITTAEERDKLIKQGKFKSPDKVHPKTDKITTKDTKRDSLHNEQKIKLLNDKDYQTFSGTKQPDIVPKETSGFLYPRPLVTGKKAEITRRDSANYSLTSSQDTSSNDSEHGQLHPLCSQNTRQTDKS